jgi:ribosomal protein S18 acetylase RimI-like enzyme
VSGPADGVRVVPVTAALGRPLRMAVLRPHEPSDRPMYPLEDDLGTLHVAAIDAAGAVLAVGSVMLDGHPGEPSPGDWRIRGMATRPELRGRGLGGRVLDACEAHARERGGRRLWCNARVGARSFYERAGMQVEGEEYEIPGIGLHLLMSKPLV